MTGCKRGRRVHVTYKGMTLLDLDIPETDYQTGYPIILTDARDALVAHVASTHSLPKNRVHGYCSQEV
jgi:hypothetical protein